MGKAINNAFNIVVMNRSTSEYKLNNGEAFVLRTIERFLYKQSWNFQGDELLQNQPLVCKHNQMREKFRINVEHMKSSRLISYYLNDRYKHNGK